jgi:2-alkyl-3-oxoalkanoate reductase
MKILVTGARGLLGSAVARTAISRGHECVVVQRNPAGVEGATEFLDDITDPKHADTWIKGVDAVIHLAAKVGVTGSESSFISTNITATVNLMQLSRDAGVSRFVFASSPSVAHTGESLVGVGALPAEPDRVRGFYSQTKASAELAVLSQNSPSFLTVALRPHLVWGPGDTQLIGRIVARARAHRLFLIGSGLALVDTTYVDNAADAFIKAVEFAPAAAGKALMVTNGEPRTVKETFDRICSAAGVPLPTRTVPYGLAKIAGSGIERVWGERETDPPITSFLVEQLATAHWFDITETKDILNWEPKVSLDEGFDNLTKHYATA